MSIFQSQKIIEECAEYFGDPTDSLEQTKTRTNLSYTNEYEKNGKPARSYEGGEKKRRLQRDRT
jgi:hypothetical protein